MNLAQKYDFIRFPMKNWESIRDELRESHRNLTFERAVDTRIVDWNRENFGSCFDAVNKIFQPFRTEVLTSRYFYYKPGTVINPHCDGYDLNPEYWALNIPIFAEEDGHFVDFYDYEGLINPTKNEDYSHFVEPSDYDSLRHTSTLVIKEPYLIKVGKFHGIKNFSGKDRLILSLKLSAYNLLLLLEHAKRLSPDQ